MGYRLNHFCIELPAFDRSVLAVAAKNLVLFAALTTGCADKTSPSKPGPLQVTATASRLHELSHETGPVSLRLYLNAVGCHTPNAIPTYARPQST